MTRTRSRPTPSCTRKMIPPSRPEAARLKRPGGPQRHRARARELELERDSQR